MADEFLSEGELKAWRESNYLRTRCNSLEAFKKYVSTINKVRRAPESMEIEIWSWNKDCYKCKKETPVVFPVGEFFGASVGYRSLTNLSLLLSQKHPCYRNNIQNFKNPNDYANACVHCGAYQGEFYIMEDYLEIAYTPEIANKEIIRVPLTDEERIFYGKSE